MDIFLLQHYLLKWKAWAWLGVYLGPSPNHSRTVHLILNPRTGHVSPQYHVNMMISLSQLPVRVRISTHQNQRGKGGVDL